MPWRASSMAREANRSSAALIAPPLVEEGIDIGLGVEGNEVVDFFAGADEANREIEFAGDGDDDSAFGGAVELGEHDAGDAGMAPEFARLIEAILARGRVEHEEHVVRRAGNDL